MSWPLLQFLWRRHRVSVSACALAPVLLGFLVGLIYPTFSREREMAEVILRMAQRFFGDNAQLDLLSPAGAFSLPFQHPLALILFAVSGSIAATALPAGERGRGALDLLLASGLGRCGLMVSVSAFQALVALMMGLGALLGASLGATVAGEFASIPMSGFLALAVNAAALSWCLGGVAALVSVLASNRASAVRATFVIVFVFFLTDIGARMWRQGSWLRWCTPYGLLRPPEVLGAQGDLMIAWRNAALLLVAALILHTLAAASEQRRSAA